LHVQAVFFEKPSIRSDPERRVIGRERGKWDLEILCSQWNGTAGKPNGR